MKCERPYCNNDMQPGFIKITKPGERIIYYCSQECFNAVHNPKRKFVFGKQSLSGYADWSQINMGGW